MSYERFDLSQLPLSGSLPSVPAVAFDVLRIVQDPDADVEHLATALGHDPMLASRVLMMANSPMYSRGGQVTSLQKAAMMLGLRALKVVALGFTLTSELPRAGDHAGLDLNAYWHRSTVTAVAGRTLASMLDRASAEEAFLAGLLSQLGKLALAQGIADVYGPVVDAAGGWPDEASEQAALGYTSSRVAEALLAQWNVPELIVVGATFAERLHELPEDVAAPSRALAELISLAQLAAGVFCGSDPGRALAQFTERAEQQFGLGDDRVGELVESLQTGVRQTGEVLALDLPAGVSYLTLLEQARGQMIAISLEATLSLEQKEQAVDELVQRTEELETRALTDALTGLPNRAALEDFLTRQVSLRLRSPLPDALGVLMIDVDHFKHFNDSYGHQAGDQVLRVVAETMRRTTRGSDLLARYGGEEFCLIMTETTPGGLRVAGERLREAIESAEVDLGAQGVVQVTASVGGACIDEVTSSGDGHTLVDAADQWLYRAKKAGRNRVEVCPRRLALAA